MYWHVAVHPVYVLAKQSTEMQQSFTRSDAVQIQTWVQGGFSTQVVELFVKMCGVNQKLMESVRMV